jgi:hypothetical protein
MISPTRDSHTKMKAGGPNKVSHELLEANRASSAGNLAHSALALTSWTLLMSLVRRHGHNIVECHVVVDGSHDWVANRKQCALAQLSNLESPQVRDQIRLLVVGQQRLQDAIVVVDDR